MKRIKYKKINDITYETMYPIKIDKGYAVAAFDLSNKNFVILNLKTNDVLFRGSGTSAHKIKIKIKDALEKLGATFSTEKRYKEIILPEE